MPPGPAVLVLLMALGAPGSGGAHQPAMRSAAAPAELAPTPPTPPAAATASASHGAQALQEDPPSLAATFGVTTTAPGLPPVIQGDWYLLRSPGRIERVRPDAGTSEIWERDDRGEVSLKRAFLNDARVVEYTPGNLRALRIEAHWEALGGAVDPRRLPTLVPGASMDTPFGRATVFEGVLAGVATEVWWLDEQRLPVRVIERRQNTRTLVVLKTLHSRPPSDWPPAAPSGFESIDVSDLGDRHYEPFAKKAEMADAVLRTMPFLGR